MKNDVTADLLLRQLDQLGVKPGGLLLVHSAFSVVGPVAGGPVGFIDALMQAVGPGGTLMMPGMADNDSLFDARYTPCRSMGVVADTFRTLPGVGHDANTTVHVAENKMRVRYGIEAHSTVLVHGKPMELRYREIDHCCRGFDRVGQLLRQRHHQRSGPLGHGTAVLAPSRQVFKAACDLLGRHREALLCESGTCNDCDAARRGYESSPASATTFVGSGRSATLHQDNHTTAQAGQQQDTSLGDLSRT